jgi:hypothetical protein
VEKVKHGSRIAKQGFANEKDMVKVFNSWRENSTATNLLQAMGYKISEIESVEAKKIPGTVKPDIKVLVTVGEQTDRHKVSCKRLEKRANYNHLCRKSVDKYQTQWGFSTAIGESLKAFTGQLKLAEHSLLKSGIAVLRDEKKNRPARRLFMDEIRDDAKDSIVAFFRRKTKDVIREVFVGTNPGEVPTWMLFTYIGDDGYSHHIHPMEEVVDFYTGNGDVSITRGGNLNIGRITLQRKGGTGSPFDMQFKFRPLTFLENKK